MRTQGVALLCGLMVALGSCRDAEGTEPAREVFIGFDEPNPASYWAVTGDGVPCSEAKPQPPGQNRFCAERVRFVKGQVTLSGEVAALGAVGSAITLRPGPGRQGAKLFPSEGTFAAKIRFRNLNRFPDRFASVKAFFTYGFSQGEAHFENDFEIFSEANLLSRDMLIPFAAPLLDQQGAASADSLLRRTRQTLLPLATAVTHIAKDGAGHLTAGAAPLGMGRAATATFIVQNRCTDGCAQLGSRVYESTYSMALEGYDMKVIGRTTSTHSPGGYDNLAVMFNLWWIRGSEVQPAHTPARQDMQVLWFYWGRDPSLSLESVVARGNFCDGGPARCSFAATNDGALPP